jgi:hypothetical protein
MFHHKSYTSHHKQACMDFKKIVVNFAFKCIVFYLDIHVVHWYIQVHTCCSFILPTYIQFIHLIWMRCRGPRVTCTTTPHVSSLLCFTTFHISHFILMLKGGIDTITRLAAKTYSYYFETWFGCSQAENLHSKSIIFKIDKLFCGTLKLIIAIHLPWSKGTYQFILVPKKLISTIHTSQEIWDIS